MFPDGGKSSFAMESMRIGEMLQISGPIGHIKYLGNGEFTKLGKSFKTKNIAMIAGGSGITPCLSVISDVMANLYDKTNISLIFANQSEEDIILYKELEALTPRLKLHHTLTRSTRTHWKGSIGYITKEMIEKHLPVDKSDC